MPPTEDFHEGVKRRARERADQDERDDANDRADMARNKANRAEREAAESARRAAEAIERAEQAEADLTAVEISTAEELAGALAKARHASAGLAVAVRCVREFVFLFSITSAGLTEEGFNERMEKCVREARELLHSIDGTQPTT